MLTIEMYLIKETLMNWFGKKIKPNYVSIPLLQKINYEQNNPIRWDSDVVFVILNLILCQLNPQLQTMK